MSPVAEVVAVVFGSGVALVAVALRAARVFVRDRAASAERAYAAVLKEEADERAAAAAAKSRSERVLWAKSMRDKITVEPYRNIRIGDPCPKCGAVTINNVDVKRGVPNYALACLDPAACPAGDRPHLHEKCVSCKSEWYCEPAETRTKVAS